MEHFFPGARLIIVCGLPGSGKTTLAKALEERLGAVRLSADEWLEALGLDFFDEEQRGRIEALQWKFGQKLLALGLILVIEWGTWGRAERDALRLGAHVELHYLCAPAEVLFERVGRRGMGSPAIEREALQRWVEIFQEPTEDEMELYDEPLASGNPE